MVDALDICLKEVRAIEPLSKEDEEELLKILSNGHTPEEKLRARNILILNYLGPAISIALHYAGKNVSNFPYLFDAVMDGLMSSVEKYPDIKNFKVYANQAMNNRARGYFRLPIKRKEPIKIEFELVKDTQPVSKSPTEIAEKRELRNTVNRLNPLEKQVIFSRYYESLTYDTVEKMTGKSYFQVRSLEKSALKKLRTMLE